MNSKIPHLIDLASQRKSTNQENYKKVYNEQFFIVAQVVVGVLIASLMNQLIGKYLDAYIPNLILYTITMIGIIFFIWLMSMELFAYNDVKKKVPLS